MSTKKTSVYTLLGLIIAFAAAPLIITYFTWAYPGDLTDSLVAGKELLILLAAGALILLVLNGEKRGLSSVGLHHKHWGKSLLWSLLLLGICIVAGLACLFVLNALGGSFGESEEASRYDSISLWTMTLVVVRAGVVEELFYRGYIMERLEELTGSWVAYFLLPLLIFALLHFRQGIGGIAISFVLGGIFAFFYWKKRDLKATIIAHFLIDFIPNVLVPLLEQPAN